MEEGLGSNDAAHAMADEDYADAGVDCWRRGAGRDFEIDYDILKPVSEGLQSSLQAW